MTMKFRAGCDYVVVDTDNDPMSDVYKYTFHCNYAEDGTVSLFLTEREIECKAAECISTVRYLNPQHFIEKVNTDEDDNEYVELTLGAAKIKIKVNACWDLFEDIDI